MGAEASAAALAGFVGFAAVAGCQRAEPLDPVEWSLYRNRFVTPEGRVVDDGNGGVSHSEGQAYGMILATAWDDRESFERIWGWTTRTLRTDDDPLFAWKWEPGPEGGRIPDPNNATDADLSIAWALARAGRLWDEPEYLAEARRIAVAIRSELVVHKGDRWLLVPGRVGFRRDDEILFNLSYWVFPALLELDRIDPHPAWKGLVENGLALARSTGFGRWHLPADWLSWNGEVGLPADREPTFGYEAIRIPLFLLWAGLDEKKTLAPYRDFLATFEGRGFVPPVVDLENDFVASYDAMTGIRAVHELVRSGTTSIRFGEGDPYYSASLVLLAKVAARERETSP